MRRLLWRHQVRLASYICTLFDWWHHKCPTIEGFYDTNMSYSGQIWLITSMSILCLCLYYGVSRSELRFTASLSEINVLKLNEYERAPNGRLDWFSRCYLRSCIIRTWKVMLISILHYQIWVSYGGFIQVSIIYGMVSYKYDQTIMISWYLVCVDHWDINMLSLQWVDPGSVDHYLNLDY